MGRAGSGARLREGALAFGYRVRSPARLTICVITHIMDRMVRQLRDEIRQTKPFASLEQEVVLSLGRTWALLDHAFAEALKPYGITPTQYNVLRILRGAGEAGLCRAEITERMLTRVPDVTRLLDRLEAVGLITRERDAVDRRYVTARITEKGLALLEELEELVLEMHRGPCSALNPSEQRALIDMLARIRAAL